MNSCAKCGACSVVCPVYRQSGYEAHTARGKLHLAELAELTADFDYQDIFATCLLCGGCSSVCPRGIDICEQVVKARALFPSRYGKHGMEKLLARKSLGHPQLLQGARLLGEAAAPLLKHLPLDSGLRLRLSLFQSVTGIFPPDDSSVADFVHNEQLAPLVYFPGCLASYLKPRVLKACKEIFSRLGYQLVIPKGLGCCGLAAWASGDTQGAEKLVRQNVEILARTKGQILFSCASCYSHLRMAEKVCAADQVLQRQATEVAERAVEFSRFLVELIGDKSAGSSSQARKKKKIRIFYHDPCHLRHGENIINEPRQLLESVAGVRLLELADGPGCCGQGGLFHIGSPEISAAIRDTLAGKVLAMHPDIITTSCSGCLIQWKMAVAAAGSDVPVMHLAEVLQL